MLETSTLTAGDLATRDVVTVHPHTSLLFAAKLMAKNRISGVPVVDEENRVVGMVSEGDLLGWRDEPSEKQAWWLNMLSEGFDLSPDFLDVVKSEREKVRNVMHSDVVTVDEQATAERVAKILIEHGIKRVPVVRDGRLVGIVSRADLVAALAKS
jgi:CBS domain-containing protein